jgi:hypothetical protein
MYVAEANANAISKGMFTFGVLTGTRVNEIKGRWWEPRKRWMFQKAYKEAHQGSFDDILTFWGEFGGVLKQQGESPNRIVDNGLEIIMKSISHDTIAVPVAAPTHPNSIQLGRGNTAWVQSQAALIDPITTNGLSVAVAVVTQLASGSAGAKIDQLQFAATFTTNSATAFDQAGEGVEEAAITLPAAAALYARTTTTQEYLLTAINDQLVVTYKTRVMG